VTGLLRLSRVEIHLASRHVLGPIDCEIAAGRPVTVMGPSGSGKSTLLNWLIGMLPAAFTASGSAFLDGMPLHALPTYRRRLGILFQDDLLFPHLTVAGNLAFGLPPGLAKGERQQRIDRALDEAELPGLGGRDPASLSGGQRSRVALMRALLAEPRALLLDEPFARLDRTLRGRFRSLIFDRAAVRGLPVLLVSHDPEDAAAAGGTVIDLAEVG
jgi:putative thiamine transport system ATP-binding protein